MIEVLAASDSGDAAVTADTVDRVRLWPTLDGTSEPRVIVLANPPKRLALGRLADRYVVGAIDEAGGVEVLDVDREGRIHARAKRPADPAAIAIHAWGAGMLVVRADQSLAWLAANDVARGPLAPEPGWRIVDLAVRDRRALAVLETADRPVAYRWLADGDRLAWGDPLALPLSFQRIALAPGGRRVAGVVRGAQVMAVVDIAPATVIVEPDLSRVLGLTMLEHLELGFASHDVLGVTGDRGSNLVWWSPPPPQAPLPPVGSGASDPWALAPSTVPAHVTSPVSLSSNVGGVAFANGNALVANGGAIALTNPKATKWLGYAEQSFGALAMHGGQPSLLVSQGVLWLDDDLQVVRSAKRNEAQRYIVQVAGERHVLTQETNYEKTNAEGYSQTTMRIRNVETQRDLELMALYEYSGFAFDAETSIATVWDDRRAERFAIDLAAETKTKLRPLAVRAMGHVHALDPARANGVIAIAIGTDDFGRLWVDSYRETPGTGTIRAATHDRFDAQLIGLDRKGSVYLAGIDKQGSYTQLSRLTAGKLEKLATISPPSGGDVTRDGTRIIINAASRNEVVLLDATTGLETWKYTIWRPHATAITGDDSEVIIATLGGLIALDMTTGERTALACGWRFGLHDEQPNTGFNNAPTVCEEGL